MSIIKDNIILQKRQPNGVLYDILNPEVKKTYSSEYSYTFVQRKYNTEDIDKDTIPVSTKYYLFDHIMSRSEKYADNIFKEVFFLGTELNAYDTLYKYPWVFPKLGNDMLHLTKCNNLGVRLSAKYPKENSEEKDVSGSNGEKESENLGRILDYMQKNQDSQCYIWGCSEFKTIEGSSYLVPVINVLMTPVPIELNRVICASVQSNDGSSRRDIRPMSEFGLVWANTQIGEYYDLDIDGLEEYLKTNQRFANATEEEKQEERSRFVEKKSRKEMPFYRKRLLEVSILRCNLTQETIRTMPEEKLRLYQYISPYMFIPSLEKPEYDRIVNHEPTYVEFDFALPSNPLNIQSVMVEKENIEGDLQKYAIEVLRDVYFPKVGNLKKVQNAHNVLMTLDSRIKKMTEGENKKQRGKKGDKESEENLEVELQIPEEDLIAKDSAEAIYLLSKNGFYGIYDDNDVNALIEEMKIKMNESIRKWKEEISFIEYESMNPITHNHEATAIIKYYPVHYRQIEYEPSYTRSKTVDSVFGKLFDKDYKERIFYSADMYPKIFSRVDISKRNLLCPPIKSENDTDLTIEQMTETIKLLKKNIEILKAKKNDEEAKKAYREKLQFYLDFHNTEKLFAAPCYFIKNQEDYNKLIFSVPNESRSTFVCRSLPKAFGVEGDALPASCDEFKSPDSLKVVLRIKDVEDKLSRWDKYLSDFNTLWINTLNDEIEHLSVITLTWEQFEEETRKELEKSIKRMSRGSSKVVAEEVKSISKTNKVGRPKKINMKESEKAHTEAGRKRRAISEITSTSSPTESNLNKNENENENAENLSEVAPVKRGKGRPRSTDKSNVLNEIEGNKAGKKQRKTADERLAEKELKRLAKEKRLAEKAAAEAYKKANPGKRGRPRKDSAKIDPLKVIQDDNTHDVESRVEIENKLSNTEIATEVLVSAITDSAIGEAKDLTPPNNSSLNENESNQEIKKADPEITHEMLSYVTPVIPMLNQNDFTKLTEIMEKSGNENTVETH